MTFELGDTVRVTYGDMHGRIGIIRRMFSATNKEHFTYGVAFSGETPLSTYRDTNLEDAANAHLIPEFLALGLTVQRLTGNEPYEVLTGGWMGKRRRYWLIWDAMSPRFAASYEMSESYDFRRFPITRDGAVLAGLWSRHEPVELAIRQVMHLVDTAPGKDVEVALPHSSR